MRVSKKKAPYLQDRGELIQDSEFIRRHLETRYQIDFDAGLSPDQKATAFAFEKMAENYIYWMAVRERWVIDRHFQRGPRQYFKAIPFLIRPFIVSRVRRDIIQRLNAQGLGRHEPAEIHELSEAALKALSDQIGPSGYLMGEAPCGADAFVHGLLTNILTPYFDTELRQMAEQHPNLKAYRDRGLARWYSDFRSP